MRKGNEVRGKVGKAHLPFFRRPAPPDFQLDKALDKSLDRLDKG